MDLSTLKIRVFEDAADTVGQSYLAPTEITGEFTAETRLFLPLETYNGFYELNFGDGKQVFDFIKTFNKAVAGDVVSGRIIERVSRRGIDVSENITKKETGKASKAPMSKAASDRVQEIYENKGVNGILEITEQFKPITTRLARKYRNVPGYDEELLIYGNYLIENKLSREQLSNFHSPAGIKLNAKSPEEIALSIMSEIIMHKNN